jgi:MinD-like ATPase involved in chromosome partitioning or flagellar assembly
MASLEPAQDQKTIKTQQLIDTMTKKLIDFDIYINSLDLNISIKQEILSQINSVLRTQQEIMNIFSQSAQNTLHILEGVVDYHNASQL